MWKTGSAFIWDSSDNNPMRAVRAQRPGSPLLPITT
jgi:hypothetical protein